MRNLKLEIEYDGANYCGWQTQKSCQLPVISSQKKSIQEIIERAAKKILREKIDLIASGRTDAGVHALAQVANFKTKSTIPLNKLQLGLNSLLPGDIVINKIEEADLNFHSRVRAKSKIYRYLILNRAFPSALLRDRVCFCPHPLNLNLMRQAAKFLTGRHDFKSFCSSGSSAKSTVRTIKNIIVKRIAYNLLPVTSDFKDNSLILIEVEADGFLYNMVRNIAGTLIDIGRGRIKKEMIKTILDSKDRRLAGHTALAGGLFLVKVNY